MPLQGAAPLGSLTVSLDCEAVLRGALQRAAEEPSLTLHLGEMWLAPSLQHDASLSSVWVEAEFPPSVLPEPRRSDKVFSKRGAISPQLRATVPLASDAARRPR